MRAIFGLVLIVGMGLAGFAVYMVKGHFAAQDALIQQQAAKAQAIVPTVEVYAASRAIAYGELLTMEDVTVIQHTQEFLPEGSYATQEELFPQGPDVARVVLRAMELNEPITAVKVTDPGEVAGITSRLTAGKVAFAINVNVTTGVAGQIRPGDRVDIFWSGRPPNSNQGLDNNDITRRIQTNIEVIAIDGSSDINRAEGASARTVTIEVDSQTAANLTQAQNSGRLTLALLGRGDVSTDENVEVDNFTMLGLTREAAPEPVAAVEAPKVCYGIERKGTERVQVEIPCTN